MTELNDCPYNKRNDKSEKFAEQRIEGDENSHRPVGHIVSEYDSQQNGYQDTRQQSDTMFFQRYKIPEIHSVEYCYCVDAKLHFPFSSASVEESF